MQTEQVLLALLRNVVCGQPLPEEMKSACTEDMIEAVYNDANRHDLAHLAGQALSKLSLPESEGLAKCKKATKQAIFRYMRLDMAYTQSCDALEKAQIPFIPLKGSVLRSYYPEPWMRTSCDIDILVHPQDLNTAVEALKTSLQFTESGKGDHDISLFSPMGVHLELHYDTMPEDYIINSSDKVLAQVWDDATPIRPGACHHKMSDGMFYFYHLAHWAKHLSINGCGIRPALDLWVLNHCIEPDAAQRKKYLEQGELLSYGQAMERLAEVWFSQAQSDPMTEQLAQYVLGCDIYGTVEQQALQSQRKMGGGLSYAFSRIFLPYDVIKVDYPILRKHKWLMPFCYIVRWSKILLRGRVGFAAKELKAIAAAPKSQWQPLKEMFLYLGIENEETEA